MEISVTDAKAQLTELVRRAERGEEVILTRHRQPAARLAAIRPVQSPEERGAIIEAVRKAARPTPGPCAARSQDFLYDERGLPA